MNSLVDSLIHFIARCFEAIYDPSIPCLALLSPAQSPIIIGGPSTEMVNEACWAGCLC